MVLQHCIVQSIRRTVGFPGVFQGMNSFSEVVAGVVPEKGRLKFRPDFTSWLGSFSRFVARRLTLDKRSVQIH